MIQSYCKLKNKITEYIFFFKKSMFKTFNNNYIVIKTER